MQVTYFTAISHNLLMNSRFIKLRISLPINSELNQQLNNQSLKQTWGTGEPGS
jgi:hypothetical protein